MSKQYMMFSTLVYYDRTEVQFISQRKQVYLDGAAMVLIEKKDYSKSMSIKSLQLLVNCHIPTLYEPPDDDDPSGDSLTYTIYEKRKILGKHYLVRDRRIEIQVMNPALCKAIGNLTDI